MAKDTPSPAAPASAGAAASAAAGPDAAPAGKSGGLKPWIPAIAAIVFAPALSWALVQFVLVPHFKKQLAEPVQVAAHAGGKDGKAGKEGTEGAPSYEFQNVVVNLAGTMGTRYLKTSFLVTGADANIKAVFEENKPRLTDVTLNVLSSLSLADLEEPGSKNVLREKLVTAYNQTLGRKVADQVYFSDFVVQ